MKFEEIEKRAIEAHGHEWWSWEELAEFLYSACREEGMGIGESHRLVERIAEKIYNTAPRPAPDIRNAAAALGRKGGKSKSAAKAAASRANGTKTQRYFFAFEFWDGQDTTTGTPNARTGRMSRAGTAHCFGFQEERDAWVSIEPLKRIPLRRKQLRRYCAGDTLEDFRAMVRNLEWHVDDTR